MDTRCRSIAKGSGRVALALAVALVGAGCGLLLTGCRLSTPRVAGVHAVVESRRVVRADQFPDRGSVYDVIASMRPEFLRPRPSARLPHTSVFPAAYLDGVLLDDLGLLRQIPVTWVVEVRYLNPPEAMMRFWRNHEAGALAVTTTR